MNVRNGFAGSVGYTPLIRLARVSEATGCEILGKAEFLNPGGSVKDRAALAIMRDAERRGVLQARRHGRRGHGRQHRHRPRARLRARGYRCVIVMPDNQSREDRLAARARRRGAPGAAEAVLRPTATTTSSPPAGRGDGRRHLGATSSTTRQPRGPLRDHRPRDLGARPAARSTPSCAAAAPAARSPARRAI